MTMHLNKFKINSVRIKGNRLDYYYDVEGEWSKYFNLDEPFFVEFNGDIDLSELPEATAIIPLLGNILPISWICDAQIIVSEIDYSFHNSIAQIKKGYAEMYNMLTFRGGVSANTIVEAANPTSSEGSIALFSGGVDAFNTLFTHISDNPLLVTLWGSDVRLDDHAGWQQVKNHVDSVCTEFNLDSVYVKTNFRKFINERELDKLVRRSGDGWWHGFQHGIGIIAHTAPIAYNLGKKVVFIASSFSKADKNVTCASDPSIDNYIKFGFSSVIHDGFEYDRSMKLSNIATYVNNTGHRIRLHVCWISTGGDNCCRCEKCLRTIMGLYAIRQNPQLYGFNYSDFNCIAKFLKDHREIMTPFIISQWGPVQRDLRTNYTLKDINRNLKWLYKADLAQVRKKPSKYIQIRDEGILMVKRMIPLWLRKKIKELI